METTTEGQRAEGWASVFGDQCRSHYFSPMRISLCGNHHYYGELFSSFGENPPCLDCLEYSQEASDVN